MHFKLITIALSLLCITSMSALAIDQSPATDKVNLSSDHELRVASACNEQSACKSIEKSGADGIFIFICKNGKRGTLYAPEKSQQQPPRVLPAQESLNKVTTGQPGSGDYWCVPNHAPYATE